MWKVPVQPNGLADLREALKWLIASSGITSAALVAGLQLTVLGSLPFGFAVMGAAAAALAIGVALTLLFVAARILTIPRMGANELCDLELNDSNTRAQPRIDLPNDPVLRWVYVNRTRLLGDANDMNSVYSEMVSARHAVEHLHLGRSVSWADRQLSPSNAADREQAQSAYEAAESNLNLIEEAVHFHLTYEAFQKLMKWFPWGATIFVLSVIVFAVAPSLGG